MANIYGEFTVSGAWNDIPSWWDDATLLVPAGRIPGTGDFVYIKGSGNLSSGPTVSVTLIGLDSTGCSGTIDGLHNVTISVGGTLAIGNATSSFQNWHGDASAVVGAVFSYASVMFGSVGNEASFNNTASMSGTVGDDATLNDSAQTITGAIIGNGATFNAGTYHTAGIVGNAATFNSATIQNGAVIGNGATFNGTTELLDCTIGDSATFNDSAHVTNGYTANIGGSAVWNDDSYYGGSAGTLGDSWHFNDISNFRGNAAPEGSTWVFRDASYMTNGSVRSVSFFDAARPVTGTVGNDAADRIIWNSSGIAGDSREYSGQLILKSPITAFRELKLGVNLDSTFRPTLGACSYRPMRPWAKLINVDTSEMTDPPKAIVIDPSALADRQLET